MRKHLVAALMAVAALSMLPALASAQSYWKFGSSTNRAGTVGSVNRSSFQLRSGPTVFLHNGTVLSPRGLRVASGMQVRVQGNSAGDGNINATEVDLVSANGYSSNGNHNGWYHNGHYNNGMTGYNNGYNNNGNNNNGNNNNGYNNSGYNYGRNNGYNGGYNGSNANRQQAYLDGRIGTIASVNSGAITLTDGLTIFLNNTSVNPQGTQLQSGMHISVRGSATADGNINASEIDVR